MDAPIFLFDVDGVVLRKDGYFSDYFCRAHGVPMGIFGNFFREDFSESVLGRADARERLTQTLAGTEFDGKADRIFAEWFAYGG